MMFLLLPAVLLVALILELGLQGHLTVPAILEACKLFSLPGMLLDTSLLLTMRPITVLKIQD
jgi:hypothetical protein